MMTQSKKVEREFDALDLKKENLARAQQITADDILRRFRLNDLLGHTDWLPQPDIFRDRGGYLLSMNQRDESTIVEVDGKSLRLTHLSKMFLKMRKLAWSSVALPLRSNGGQGHGKQRDELTLGPGGWFVEHPQGLLDDAAKVLRVLVAILRGQSGNLGIIFGADRDGGVPGSPVPSLIIRRLVGLY